jgi:Mycoplasma protein of unknown function, DUF285.
MFQEASIANPDLQFWNSQSVTDMRSMFEEAFEAETAITITWNTWKVSDMANMFLQAGKANPNVENWDTFKVSSMQNMFQNASSAVLDGNQTNSMTGYDSEGRAARSDGRGARWDVSYVTLFDNMFFGATLANPHVYYWNTYDATTMENMFRDAPSAVALSGPHWNTWKVTNMDMMFSRATLANPGDLEVWNTHKVTSMYEMLHYASSAEFLGTLDWDVSQVKSFERMFANATSASPDLSKWNTQSATVMRRNVSDGQISSFFPLLPGVNF